MIFLKLIFSGKNWKAKPLPKADGHVNVSSAPHHVGGDEIGPGTMGHEDRFLQVLVWRAGIIVFEEIYQ